MLTFTASIGGIVHHFTASSAPLAHAHLVTSLHTHVTSSGVTMVTTAQAHMANLALKEGSLQQTPISQVRFSRLFFCNEFVGFLKRCRRIGANFVKPNFIKFCFSFVSIDGPLLNEDYVKNS